MHYLCSLKTKKIDCWLNNTKLNPDHERKIPERTSHRHRDAIADLFGIDIECDPQMGTLNYIFNLDALEDSSFTAWLFNGLSIENQLADNAAVNERVVFEKTSSGIEYTSTIINAISNQQLLKVSYRRFNQGA